MGRDYTLIPNEVIFDFGVHNGSPRTSIVTVLDDLQVEGTETLTLSGRVTRATLSASFVGDPVTVDILDDDSKFEIASSITEYGMLYIILLQWTNLPSMLAMVKNTC